MAGRLLPLLAEYQTGEGERLEAVVCALGSTFCNGSGRWACMSSRGEQGRRRECQQLKSLGLYGWLVSGR